MFPFLLPDSHFREFFSQLFFDLRILKNTYDTGAFCISPVYRRQFSRFSQYFSHFGVARDQKTGSKSTASTTKVLLLLYFLMVHLYNQREYFVAGGLMKLWRQCFRCCSTGWRLYRPDSQGQKGS